MVFAVLFWFTGEKTKGSQAAAARRSGFNTIIRGAFLQRAAADFFIRR
jgi:hypothetical protein